MFPTIPSELVSSAIELVGCFFAVVVAFVTLSITARG